MTDVSFVEDRETYERVVLEAVPQASAFLWIATSDLKDLHVHSGGEMAPFLKVLSELAEKGVELRMIHAKEPGPAFRRDFDRFPNLVEGMEMMLCPRAHCKMVIRDGDLAYIGSANMTGAGMGAKGEHRRNFEAGILTADKGIVEKAMNKFDIIWSGAKCGACQRKEYCATFPDMK